MLKLASSSLSGQDRLALRYKKLKNFLIVGYEVKIFSRPTLVTRSQSGEPATASSCSLSSQPGSTVFRQKLGKVVFGYAALSF